MGEQSFIDIAEIDPTAAQLLPPINVPQDVAPVPAPIPGELLRKIINNQVLTPAEVDFLNGTPTSPQQTIAQGVVQAGRSAGDLIGAITGEQAQGALVAIGADVAGSAIGALGGNTLGGAAIGGVAGALINQALGLEDENLSSLIFAGVTPKAVDITSDALRGVGRRMARMSREGRKFRAGAAQVELDPLAIDLFTPALAREMDIATDRIVRTRPGFIAQENEAFNAVRTSGTLIDLSDVGAAILNLPRDTRNLLRREFTRRTNIGAKFNALVPQPSKMPIPPSSALDPNATLFDGQQLVEFRQRLGDIRTSLGSRQDSAARARRGEIQSIQRTLDDVIDTTAARMDGTGRENAATLLRRANRVSQMRMAVDEWDDLLNSSMSILQVGRHNVPEFNMGAIDKAVSIERRLVARGREGGDLNTFVRLVNDQPGGFDTYEELMQNIRQFSPANNLTVFDTRDSMMTRTVSGARRIVSQRLLNESIINPVARKLLANQIRWQGHATVNRRMLAMMVAVGRVYINQGILGEQEAKFLELMREAGIELRNRFGMAAPPQAPASAAGALTQLLPQPQQAGTQLGPENLNIPTGFQRPQPTPAGIFTSETLDPALSGPTGPREGVGL